MTRKATIDIFLPDAEISVRHRNGYHHDAQMVALLAFDRDDLHEHLHSLFKQCERELPVAEVLAELAHEYGFANAFLDHLQVLNAEAAA